MLVGDDGTGFEAGKKGGQGLRNNARAESIGGAFEVCSQPGHGTVLKVVLRS